MVGSCAVAGESTSVVAVDTMMNAADAVSLPDRYAATISRGVRDSTSPDMLY